MHPPGMEYYKSNQPAGSAAQTPTSNFEHANLLLVSVGGADRRIPRCNHLTLFGSAVSVEEFPPHRKLDASEVSRQEKLLRLTICSESPLL